MTFNLATTKQKIYTRPIRYITYFLIMRCLLFLLVACFSLDLSSLEYFFHPIGDFSYISYSCGESFLKDFRFDHALITKVVSEEHQKIGTIEKLNDWTRGYAWKQQDSILSTHRSFLLSCGSFVDSLKRYEVRDEEENLIGTIEGIWFTKDPAEFFFFDSDHKVFAKAVLNPTRFELIFKDPEGKSLVICRKTLHIRPGMESTDCTSFKTPEYKWRIQMNDPSLDERFLWPFMAFISEVWW